MINVVEGQSFLDLAIQENGSVLAAFDLALANGLSITDDLESVLWASVPKKEYESLDVALFIKEAATRNEIVTVIENQSLFDIAIQTDGNVLASFEWAVANGFSITDTLAPGQIMKMPKSEVFRYEDLANYFKNRNIATGFSTENSETPTEPDGIGYMIIESTFIVR